MTERQSIQDVSIDKDHEKAHETRLRLASIDGIMELHRPPNSKDKPVEEPRELEFTNIFEEHMKKKDEWTAVVNLTSTGPSKIGDTTVGSEHKLRQLLSLAEQTKDKPVTLLVQAIKLDEQNTDRPRTRSGPPAPNTELERYVIRDGEIKYLSTTKSKGLGDDLKNILEIAEKDYPAKQLALVQSSHGNGNDGVSGDNGKLSTKDMAETINKVLKDSGRYKLSLLNFDACLMGEESVLELMKESAEHIVASTEPESFAGDLGIDGQNIKNVIESVLKNPYANGDTLAEEMVNVAPKNTAKMEENETASGNVTLSHFDVRKMPEFSKSLSSFADQLTTLCINEKDRQTLAQIIDEVPRVAPNEDPFQINGDEERDIKKFAEKIIQNSSKFSNGEALAKAAGELLNSQNSLVRNHYVQPDKKRLEDTGGLNLFLPSGNYLDADRTAERKTPAYLLNGVLNNILQKPENLLKPEGHEMFTRMLDERMQKLKLDLQDSPDARKSVQEMETAVQELLRCDKPETITNAACKMKELTVEFMRSEAQHKSSEQLYKPKTQEQIEDRVRREMDASNPAWQRFLKTWANSYSHSV